MKNVKMFVLVCKIIILASCSRTASSNMEVKNVMAAKALFEEQKCAICHGPNGEGNIGPNLKTGLPMSRSIEQITMQITNGSGVMPAFKDKLSQEQINELAKYVYREIQKR